MRPIGLKVKLFQRQETRPHLILSNLNMPDMNGIELLSKLQASTEFRAIPVVIISSSRLTSDRAHCLALGAREFITKSADFQVVISAMKRACAFSVDGAVIAESAQPQE